MNFDITSTSTVVTSILTVLIVALCIVLVRYITRWADKILDGYRNHKDEPTLKPEDIQAMMAAAADEAARRADDRIRKRLERAQIEPPAGGPAGPQVDDVTRDFHKIAFGGE